MSKVNKIRTDLVLKDDGIVVFIIFILIVFKPINDFSLLEIGMHEAQVIEILGEADEIFYSDNLCNINIIDYSTCDEFIAAGSKSIKYWPRGIDTWVIVGFDDNNNVCFKLIRDT